MYAVDMATATSEEVWQDCLQERLLQIVTHLENKRLLPDGYKIDLRHLVHTPGEEKTFVSLVASGEKHPLTFAFQVERGKGTIFYARPTSPGFEMKNSQLPGGYTLDPAEAFSAAALAADILLNYRDTVRAPSFTALNPRVPKHVPAC